VGDIAIFVNFDSADVWTHPDLFRLNSELDPEVVAGVPSGFFQQRRPALGQSALSLGRDEGAGICVVDRSHALGHAQF
jgi:hypothetical protein